VLAEGRGALGWRLRHGLNDKGGCAPFADWSACALQPLQPRRGRTRVPSPTVRTAHYGIHPSGSRLWRSGCWSDGWVVVVPVHVAVVVVVRVRVPRRRARREVLGLETASSPQNLMTKGALPPSRSAVLRIAAATTPQGPHARPLSHSAHRALWDSPQRVAPLALRVLDGCAPRVVWVEPLPLDCIRSPDMLPPLRWLVTPQGRPRPRGGG